MMEIGTVQKLITIFNQSFQQLGAQVPPERLESLAVTIHRAMTAQARHFHTLEHVFTFVDPGDPLRTLAALYHDIVYYQVDMGFSPSIWEIVAPCVRQEHTDVVLSDVTMDDDRLVALTLDIFHLAPGQKLSSLDMLNEFLSALVMNKQLSDLLPEKDLLRMTLCIEATIPFRGRAHFDNLEKYLEQVVAKYQIELSPAELEEAVKVAVAFSNKDIENFAEVDPGRFLDSTWKLLPETNAALRLPDVYSIGTYRQALQRMETFFEGLDPDSIFNQYHGIPPDDEFHRMARQARRNINVAREYLRIKILANTILESLARATGGDAPLSLFMGDVPREGVSIKRLEYFLPELEDAAWIDHNSDVYHLLESGRASDTAFDMRNSPLSLFIYKSVPPQKIVYYLERAQDFYEERISAEEYLSELEPAIIQPIARASSIMVVTRRQALLKYAGEAGWTSQE